MKLRFNFDDEVTDFISSKDALFHFTKKNISVEYILSTGKIRFGGLLNTNDPQEYKNRLISTTGWGWEDKHFEQIDNSRYEIKKIIMNSGFLSFCQNRYNDGNVIEQGCLKSRMWSQYGEDHSGICLVFSKEQLIESVQNESDSYENLFHDNTNYIDPYDTDERDTLFVNADELDSQSSIKIASKYVQQSYKELFFLKQPDYRDENEYRIVITPKYNECLTGKLHKFKNSLKAIILGDKFPKVYKPTIEVLSDDLGIPYRKLHWEKNHFDLLSSL